MQNNDIIETDVLIAGTGVAGLFSALYLSPDRRVLIITKEECEHSDSFLAQGGICVLRGMEDYDSFFEDTLKAGHFENSPAAVHTMISSSRAVINQLVAFGVPFERENGNLCYTREGAHKVPRILYHQDTTGDAITSCLLKEARKRSNITIMEHTTMVDLIAEDNHCYGAVVRLKDGTLKSVLAHDTILATGGIGGLYSHSTNFPHLTGDGLALSLKHNVALQNIDYIQIHPTTLYSKKPGRRFLISESVRGEGAILLNAAGERFVNELQPRDIVAKAIFKQMELDGKPYVRLSLEKLDREMILHHFPTIYERCLEEGYDVTKEPVPVVPAQHYFMGGIKIDLEGRTSMRHLYAAGETACNGVHGANRLASNSLLESLVFAQRAAFDINCRKSHISDTAVKLAKAVSPEQYADGEQLKKTYREQVLAAIETEKGHKNHE